MNKVVCILLLFPYTLFSQIFIDKEMCNTYIKQNKVDSLKEYLEKIELNFNYEQSALFYYYKSFYYNLIQDNENQLKSLLKGTELVAEDESWLQAKFYDQFSIIYLKEGDGILEEALNFVNRSIAIKEKIGDKKELTKSYIKKGNVFYNARLRENNLDSAMHCFVIAKRHNTDKKISYSILNSINTIYVNQGIKLDSIEINFDSIINYYNSINDFRFSAISTNSLASFYRRQGRYDESKLIYDTLLNHVTINNWQSLKNHVLSSMYKLYEAKGDYKTALRLKDSLYYIQYADFKQSLTKVEKEHENEKLKLELAQTEASQYKNRLWLSILGGTTGTLCIILFGLYKYFSLKRQKVEQALEAAQMKAAFDATKAKMEGEQKERESIASVLHDQVASLLTAADLHLNVAKKKDPSAQGITKAVGIIKDINSHVRDLSHQLVSPSLIKFGLEAGLDTLVDKMQSDQTHITYVSTLGARRYDSSLETFIHQCASEFLQNVMKHSSASQAKLVIKEEGGKIVLSVVDNGDNRGVSIKAPTGLGLTHIKARAAALGGSFSFTLNPIGAESILEVPAIGVLA